LFYENSDFARNIEYRYILNGLQKGESCVYTTHHREPQSIKKHHEKIGYKCDYILEVDSIADDLD